jgi:hypothetical protein
MTSNAIGFRPASSLLGAVALLAPAVLTAPAQAQGAPAGPSYSLLIGDAITGDNVFTFDGRRYWPVDPGADVYQIDVYERPTIQTHEHVAGQYAAKEYWENLDLICARFGYDARYMYVSVHLNGLYRLDEGGDHLENLKYNYAFRFSTNPDGRHGYKFVGETPFNANSNPTQYGRLKTFGYRDTDGDVGGAATSGPTGLNVTKQDNPEEEHGLDGYDLAIVSDGRLQSNNQTILWQRIDPMNPTRVEFALDYVALGLTQAYVAGIQYFDCEANKGLQDPQNHLWNDKYTRSEAGSPNPGPNGLSEFGTQGTGNIYELDTLRIGRIPPPVEELCPGDGAANGGSDCPCGNNVPAGTMSGCANGLGGGGVLAAAGNPSVSNDTLVLTATIPPAAPGFFFQGTETVLGGSGAPFGNGLRCVAGSIVRMQKIVGASGAGSVLPVPGDPPISVRFGLQAGDLRYYQVWYRNPTGPCGEPSNFTNALRVTWLP